MKFLLERLKRRWLYHGLIWWVFFMFTTINVELANRELQVKFTIIPLYDVLLPFVLVVYSNFYIKGLFFKKGSYLKYFLFFLFVNFLFGMLSSFIDFEDGNILSGAFWHDVLFEFLGAMIIGTLANGLQFFKRTIANNQKFKYELRELKMKNTESELQSLKAQINPHFLFNNLNNIYAINQIDAEKGSEMILELAEVMRYHLQFSKQTQISLSEEAQLIKSYIELEKLRLSGNCDLQIDIKDNLGNILIPPLLLLPFIENAFKHGTHPTESCFVHLDLKTDKQHLYFNITNSIITNKKIVKNNIGLKNTEKRLDLLYPKRHQLKSEKTDKTYQVNLEIDL